MLFRSRIHGYEQFAPKKRTGNTTPNQELIRSFQVSLLQENNISSSDQDLPLEQT